MEFILSVVFIGVVFGIVWLVKSWRGTLDGPPPPGMTDYNKP